eukprot:COSAG04_NODE_2298_length_4363_cov_6.625820_3_plen_50_part_00
MADALVSRGYDVEFIYGVGMHSLRHGGSVFGETLRWINRPRDAQPSPKL